MHFPVAGFGDRRPEITTRIYLVPVSPTRVSVSSSTPGSGALRSSERVIMQAGLDPEPFSPSQILNFNLTLNLLVPQCVMAFTSCLIVSMRLAACTTVTIEKSAMIWVMWVKCHKVTASLWGLRSQGIYSHFLQFPQFTAPSFSCSFFYNLQCLHPKQSAFPPLQRDNESTRACN